MVNIPSSSQWIDRLRSHIGSHHCLGEMPKDARAVFRLKFPVAFQPATHKKAHGTRIDVCPWFLPFWEWHSALQHRDLSRENWCQSWQIGADRGPVLVMQWLAQDCVGCGGVPGVCTAQFQTKHRHSRASASLTCALREQPYDQQPQVCLEHTLSYQVRLTLLWAQIGDRWRGSEYAHPQSLAKMRLRCLRQSHLSLRLIPYRKWQT